MLFFGAFIMRYRMELILAFPLVAWLMAIYFGLSFRYARARCRTRKSCIASRIDAGAWLCVGLFWVLLFVDLPGWERSQRSQP